MLFAWCQRFTDSARPMWKTVRLSWAILTLVIYWFGGAYIFYVLEHNFEAHSHRPIHRHPCLAHHGYWASLHYAATLYTTIGYGDVYCCSDPARIFAALYIFFGAPLLLIVLDTIGKALTRFTSFCWRRFKRLRRRLVKIFCRCVLGRRRKRGTVVPPDRATLSGKNGNDDELLPLWIGVLFSASWVLAISGYFTALEGWTFYYSMYVTWITFTTVGLGESAPTKFEYTALNYLLIIIGLSLVSMCVNILQMHIERVVQKMRDSIETQYRETLLGDAEPRSEPKDVRKKTQKTKASLNQTERLAAIFMSKTDWRNVKRLKEKRLAMKNKSVQVNLPLPTKEDKKDAAPKKLTLQNIAKKIMLQNSNV